MREKLRMKKIKTINIRKFSRKMYSYLNDLPVAVYNKRTGKIMFVVISPEKGGKYIDSQTKDSIQSNK